MRENKGLIVEEYLNKIIYASSDVSVGEILVGFSCRPTGGAEVARGFKKLGERGLHAYSNINTTLLWGFYTIQY
jgi:hypothetical protein